MKSLLMATDLSARSDRALERAIAIARDHGAALTILHVVDDDLPAPLKDSQEDFARKAIQDHFNSLKRPGRTKVTISVVFGRPHAAILETAANIGAEMIVLGLHRGHELKDMFLGSTVERVIRAGHFPVLLVKDRFYRPYRRVLVGVDFSVCSRQAMEFAVGFLPKAEFHLVHAYEIPFKGFGYGENTRNAVREQHKAKFQGILEEEMDILLDGIKGKKLPKIIPVLEEGMVWDVLKHRIARIRPDLLVIGTHGRTGVAHAIFGSVAEAVLRDPPCDVIAVKGW